MILNILALKRTHKVKFKCLYKNGTSPKEKLGKIHHTKKKRKLKTNIK